MITIKSKRFIKHQIDNYGYLFAPVTDKKLCEEKLEDLVLFVSFNYLNIRDGLIDNYYYKLDEVYSSMMYINSLYRTFSEGLLNGYPNFLRLTSDFDKGYHMIIDTIEEPNEHPDILISIAKNTRDCTDEVRVLFSIMKKESCPQDVLFELYYSY